MLTVGGISRINLRLKINNLAIISNIDPQVVTSSKAVALHNLLQLPKTLSMCFVVMKSVLAIQRFIS